MTRHGGKRKGAGRPQGKLSEAKQQIAEMLEEHVPTAIETLAAAAKDGDIMAARDILDRVYGKPRQSIEHEPLQEELQTVVILPAEIGPNDNEYVPVK